MNPQTRQMTLYKDATKVEAAIKISKIVKDDNKEYFLNDGYLFIIKSDSPDQAYYKSKPNYTVFKNVTLVGGILGAAVGLAMIVGGIASGFSDSENGGEATAEAGVVIVLVGGVLMVVSVVAGIAEGIAKNNFHEMKTKAFNAEQGIGYRLYRKKKQRNYSSLWPKQYRFRLGTMRFST